MVGEIRDLETAEIAIKAAQTGHMVLSTLHTNDAPTTLTRLMNMGIAPFNIASSVILITAQRLARRLCTCKKPVDIPTRTLLGAGFKEDDLDGTWQPYGPVGCERCKGTGYKGRVGIYQIMPISDEIERIIMTQRQRARDRRPGAGARACGTCAQSGLRQGQAGPDLARGSARRHQRVTRRTATKRAALGTPQATDMATAAAGTAGARRQGIHLRLGRQRQGRQDGASGEMRASGETVVNVDAAPPGHRGHQGQEAALGGGKKITEKDITLFTRQLATMMKAGVPLLQSFDIVGKGHANPAVAKLLHGHQDRRRDRDVADAGVPQVPALLRQPVLQPGGRRRTGRYPRRPARPPGDLQGKDPRDQGQDQVGAVLPDLDPGGGLHRHRGHHDLRDAGVQERVQELRRRPARADAGR